MLHPHDEALLYDLLDGRLAPAAADEVRRRIDDEPELRAAWDDLGRIRAHLRALPTTPVPEAFGAAVRARAGLPPAVVASNGSVHGAAPRSIAASDVESAAGPRTERPPRAPSSALGPEASVERRAEAPVLRMPRWWMAAAARLGVALGAGVFWALAQEKASVHTAVETGAVPRKRAPVSDPASSGGPAAPYGATREESKPAGTGAATGGTPHYGAPGGGVAPGLREPSDSSVGPPPGGSPAAPAGAGTSGAPAPGGVRDAEGDGAGPGPTPVELAKSRDASTRGGGGGGVAPPAPVPPAPVPPTLTPPTSGGFPGAPAMGDGPPVDPARGAGWKSAEPSVDGPAVPAEDEKTLAGALPAATATRRWASEGVDDVVVLRADSLDAARAEIALLGDLRDPSVLARLRPRLTRIEALGCVAPPIADLLALEKVQDKSKAPGAKAAGKAEAPADDGDVERADRRKAGEGGAPGARRPAPVPAEPASPTGRGAVAPVAPPPPPAAPPAQALPSVELQEAKAAEEALSHPLGSLRIDLDVGAWRRLEAALAPLAAACTVAGDEKDAAAAMDGKASGDDAAAPEKQPSAIRRVRILVLPR